MNRNNNHKQHGKNKKKQVLSSNNNSRDKKKEPSSTITSNVNSRMDSMNKKEDKPSPNSVKNEKKRVSFSSSLEPTVDKNVVMEQTPKRKLRDVSKLILSPSEPVGYLVVFSNAKQQVREDDMTLWKLDPNNEEAQIGENRLSEIRFGTDAKTNNVQIKRAVNKKWPILENHCVLTYLDNSIILALEKGALVLVNGVAYKNTDSDEEDVICTNRVNISNGDIIDLDGRLLIYSKYKATSYRHKYQQKFEEYIQESHKRKRESEDEEHNKKIKLEEGEESDEEETFNDMESEEEVNEDIDSEEIHHTLSEYGAEQMQDDDQDLGGLESNIEDVPGFFSQPPQTPQLKDLKTNARLMSQSEESQYDEEAIVVDPDFLDEIIQKLSSEASAKIEELELKISTQQENEKEFKAVIENMQKSLEEEVTKTKKFEDVTKRSIDLEKRVQQLEKLLSDKDEELMEHKRSLEKSIQRADRSEGFKKDYEKLKYKTTDLESKLEEKNRMLETCMDENKILKLSSENMRTQLSSLRKSSLLFETIKDTLQKNEKKPFWDNFESVTRLVTDIMKKTSTPLGDNDPTLILSADDIETSQIASPKSLISNKGSSSGAISSGKKPLTLTRQTSGVHYARKASNSLTNFIKPTTAKPTTPDILDGMDDDDFSAILEEEDYKDYENLSE